METTSENNVKKMTFAELQVLVLELQARIVILETPKVSKNGSPREMTADDAKRILTGDHMNSKHQVAADALGLSYGQVYSCRLEFTFKAVHKEMKDNNIKNIWKK
jgi:hypothetical protein